ncbi:MAG TPA: alpha/beta fold hydrolase [Candidatus Tectomicrobia bacterium]|nr:alpha/beta fold hydrolase [Candidatus Tectomicrobia bacterium]
MTPPGWLDRRAYPFASRWADVPGGRIHYVDEGGGPPVVMVHGAPTWSFLYRHLVAGLRGAYRCVAPDNLGFGLSERPRGVSYRPADQAARLGALIETLGLKDFALVVHDFGGPIGLAHAVAHPEQVRALVLFNTWMWSLRDDPRAAWPARALASPLGRWLYHRRRFSVEVVWKRALADRRRYTPAVHAQYARAADGPVTWAYAREVLASSDWYEDLWRRRDRLARLPALLVWGRKDPAFGRALERWRPVFERAEIVELADVGHAPPEERGPEVAAVVRRFLDGLAA